MHRRSLRSNASEAQGESPPKEPLTERQLQNVAENKAAALKRFAEKRAQQEISKGQEDQENASAAEPKSKNHKGIEWAGYDE